MCLQPSTWDIRHEWINLMLWYSSHTEGKFRRHAVSDSVLQQIIILGNDRSDGPQLENPVWQCEWRYKDTEKIYWRTQFAKKQVCQSSKLQRWTLSDSGVRGTVRFTMKWGFFAICQSLWGLPYGATLVNLSKKQETWVKKHAGWIKAELSRKSLRKHAGGFWKDVLRTQTNNV